jgi:aspartate/methionine/tyrosine aminotransferase
VDVELAPSGDHRGFLGGFSAVLPGWLSMSATVVATREPRYPRIGTFSLRSASCRWTCERERKSDINPHPIDRPRRLAPGGLIVAHPANPTGAMLSAAELQALAQYCRERGIRLVSDGSTTASSHEHDPVTALAIDEEAIVINSFSKYFSMTGWRLGWGGTAGQSGSPCLNVSRRAYSFRRRPYSQLAALAAFDAQAELDAKVALYRRNRDLLIPPSSRKQAIDRFLPPEGALLPLCGRIQHQ